MPTVITHAAVPLAIGIGLGSKLVPPRLLLAGIAASMIPDLDVIGLKLGIAYAEDMGHRGITHSLLFAMLAGAAAYVWSGRLSGHRLAAGLFVFVSFASHGLLDMCTNGGLGIAYLWPFSHERHFLPWHLIQVSPLTLDKVLSARGVQVMYSEMKWVWLPCISLGLALAAGRYGAKRLRPAEMNRT